MKKTIVWILLFLLLIPVSVSADSGTAFLETGDSWRFEVGPAGQALLSGSRHEAWGIVRVPGVLLGHPVTEIGPDTILARPGSHIILPTGISAIGPGAFSGSGFSVYIPASVTQIRAAAFSGCAGYTIYAPEGSAASAFAEANRIPLVTDPGRARIRSSVPSDADYPVYSEACHEHAQGHYRTAFHLLYRIAGPENPHAALLLGECLTNGRGCGKNKYAAFDFYRIAADAGLSRAQYETGRCLIQGSGTAKDPAEAVRYLTMAADQQEPISWLWLGYCYHKGVGVPRDFDKAEDLYTRAFNANVHYSRERLDELARDRLKGA